MNQAQATVVNLPVRRFICTLCGFDLPPWAVPRTARAEILPDEFTCPGCGAGKEWLVEA